MKKAKRSELRAPTGSALVIQRRDGTVFKDRVITGDEKHICTMSGTYRDGEHITGSGQKIIFRGTMLQRIEFLKQNVQSEAPRK